MLQKNAFGKKKFEFDARVEKSHFAKSILLKDYETVIN